MPEHLDSSSPPFDRFTALRRLSPERRGHASEEHARHQLYAGRDKSTRQQLLVKLATKPGLVYQQDLSNEIASLSTINRELPDSRYFPMIHDQGTLSDGRVYLVTTLFDELPLATSIGTEWVPARLVAHLRTALEIATALLELHGLQIIHVDLNPMNILHRVEKGKPVIRIVDFESSYEVARHSSGAFYSPPTTPGYSAPEVSRQAPDVRADLFSLGVVLYTMLAGYQWTKTDPRTRIEADRDLDPELRDVLMSAVAPDPSQRYPSVYEFRTALAAYLERIWPGRPW